MRKYTTIEIIAKAKTVHGNKYDYTSTVYTNARTPMSILCPLHGMFKSTSDNHINKGRGCPKCANNVRLTTKEYVGKCKVTHGDLYDYSITSYVSAHKPVKIICKKHGMFSCEAKAHRAGSGCPKCSKDGIKLAETKFWEEVKAIHGNNYLYTNSNYNGSSNAITVTCKIHGDFSQIAGSHLRGSGCPLCAKGGFALDKPAILYYVKLLGTPYYKIGITGRSLKERFTRNSDYKKLKTIKTWSFNVGKDALLFENQILKANSRYRYKGVTPLLYSGNTELFTRDVLSLDT